MKVKSNLVRTAASCLFVMFFFGVAFAAASTPEDAHEKTVTSTRKGSLVIALTNDTGKLTPGENHFCVLFQSVSPSTAIDIQEVSVDFTLLVGRIEEAPLTAHLSANGVFRFCGRIDLGRQYYHPASYYAFVRYVEATGKKTNVRLFFAVK